MNSSKFLFQHISTSLASLGKEEAEAIAFALLTEFFQVSRIDIFLDKTIDKYDSDKVSNALKRLLDHEPLQYIIGHTEFYGYKFKVTPAVLIPRPETEELVDLIVKDHSGMRSLRILDLCTGSGCIAISLALSLPGSEVTAVDISEAALQIASENNQKLNANVKFIQADVLGALALELAHYDIIVSNPPYVMEEEAKLMAKNVLDYEPHMALFVPDEDALKFYNSIINVASNSLISGGKCYFEINEQKGKAIAEMMEMHGIGTAIILKDLRGKERMIYGIK